MKFEWDETKRRRNIDCHQLDFIDVADVFDNPKAVRMEDNRKDYGEQRFILLCEKDNQLLHVTYTLREDAVRIISARKGNRRERKHYEKAQEN